MGCFWRNIFLLFGLGTLASCDSAGVEGEVVIRNDIQDAEYNRIAIDQVVTAGGSSGFKVTLSPGEEIAVPAKNVTGFRVTRVYADFSRIYAVACPAKKQKTLMKLIDIHLNKLPNGCRLVRAGELREGVVRWK